MKKQVKKLKLAKETVRDLEAAILNKVAGGTDYRSCPYCLEEPIYSMFDC